MNNHPISDPLSEGTEPHSITGLDLTDPVRLAESVQYVCRDLTQILTYFAGNAQFNSIESTHHIRKKLKFFRAFIKLIKLYHPDEFVMRVNILLRDYGRIFSGLRDAHVRSLMMDELISPPELQLSAEWLQQLKDIIRNDINHIESGLFEPKNKFLEFAEELEKNELIKKYMVLKKPDPEWVINTFRRSFEKSSFTYQQAFSLGEAEFMHEWRKRLKDVQYQFELILKNLSPVMHESYFTVELLCNHLGRYNDLDMLQDWLKQTASSDIRQSAESSILDDYLTQQSDELYHEIKSLGQHLNDSFIFKR